MVIIRDYCLARAFRQTRIATTASRIRTDPDTAIIMLVF